MSDVDALQAEVSAGLDSRAGAATRRRRFRVSVRWLTALILLEGLLALDLSSTAVTDEGLGRVREWFPLAGVTPTKPTPAPGQ